MKLPKLPKFLNPKKEADQVKLLRRFTGTGFGQASPEKVAKITAEKSEKDMRKQVKKALKKGEKVTADNLVAPLKERKDFMEFCEKELGLDLAFFEGLAEKVIRDVGG